MVRRFKPEFKPTGSNKYSGFRNGISFGERSKAEAFVKKTRAIRRKAGKAGSGRFRIITQNL